MISKNLLHINGQIKQCCSLAERCHNSVRLLAVSKTKPIDAIIKAIKAGQTLFGENYVQEGASKIDILKDTYPHLEWHFIGPLQSNKTKLVAQYYDWVQTIDRIKIADRLNDQRPTNLPPLQVLIQINISNETTKSGITTNEMLPVANHIMQLPNLDLRGLMAIPAPTDNSVEQQRVFSQMKNLFNLLQQHFPTLNIDTLSMGMSEDMQSAIQHGATMVRIGSAIFGKRD